MIKLKSIFVTFIFLCIASSFTFAQDDQGLDIENPLYEAFPELASMPAPGEISEGLRATYYSATATIPKDRYYYYVSQSGTIIEADEVGPSGEGFIQFDIVGLDGKAAIYAMMYGLQNDRIIPLSGFGSITPASCGDFWCNPGIFSKAIGLSDGPLTVVPFPLEVSGQNYQGIRFEYNDASARYVSVYDKATGLLLYYQQAIPSSDGKYMQLAIIELRHVRKVQVPWQSSPVPSWLKDGYEITYEGQDQLAIPGTPSGTLPVSVQIQVTSIEHKAVSVRLIKYLQGAFNSATSTVSGSSQLTDALWLPAEAIACLKVGLIDQDPITGIDTSVAYNGEHGVAIQQKGQGYLKVLGYNRESGWLNYLYQEQVTDPMLGTVSRQEITVSNAED